MRKPIPFAELTKPPKAEYYAAYAGRDVWGLGHYGMDAYNDGIHHIEFYYIGRPAGGNIRTGKKLIKQLKVVKINKRDYEYIENHSGFGQAARARGKKVKK